MPAAMWCAACQVWAFRLVSTSEATAGGGGGGGFTAAAAAAALAAPAAALTTSHAIHDSVVGQLQTDIAAVVHTQALLHAVRAHPCSFAK